MNIFVPEWNAEIIHAGNGYLKIKKISPPQRVRMMLPLQRVESHSSDVKHNTINLVTKLDTPTYESCQQHMNIVKDENSLASLMGSTLSETACRLKAKNMAITSGRTPSKYGFNRLLSFGDAQQTPILQFLRYIPFDVDEFHAFLQLFGLEGTVASENYSKRKRKDKQSCINTTAFNCAVSPTILNPALVKAIDFKVSIIRLLSLVISCTLSWKRILCLMVRHCILFPFFRKLNRRLRPAERNGNQDKMNLSWISGDASGKQSVKKQKILQNLKSRKE